MPVMDTPRTIVGLGEALFDLVDNDMLLGGAPLNVATHAHALGNLGTVVSRIGQDDLGQRLLAALHERGMPTDHVQQDPDRPTGTVRVSLSLGGEPTYTIDSDVAWDALHFDPDLESLARHTDAVCFGTLAQRCAESRSTIQRFVESATRAVRLLDINLRADFEDRRVLERSLELANALKINADELNRLNHLFQLGDDDEQRLDRLRRRFNLGWIALTRGAAGTTVFTDQGSLHAAPVAASPGGDPVGAGDATAAALLHGAVRHWDWPRTLTLANTLGAHVASCRGACPPHTDAIRQLVGLGAPAD